MSKSTVISPTKGFKGEQESYLASVKFKVNVSRGFSTSYYASTQGKPLLKPGTNGDTFEEVDIFKKQEEIDDIRFYIFDPNRYKPSNDLKLLKETRQKLQTDLRLASGKTGCFFASSCLKSWGLKTNNHFKWFHFCCSKSRMNTTTTCSYNSIDETDQSQEYNTFKLAAINGSRKVHGRKGGNKGFKRKSSKYSECYRKKPQDLYIASYLYFKC